MWSSLRKIFSLSDLRSKILFSFFLLAACRLGVFIPVPGVDAELALTAFRKTLGGGQNLFQLVDVFSGGAFSQMTIAALGVMPYISASIIVQLFTALSPSVQRELKEDPEGGKRKLQRWTRLATLGLAGIQSMMFARYIIQSSYSIPGLVVADLLTYQLFSHPCLFYLLVMMSMTTGTLLLMWVGEQITERGIGNGMSLIITSNILASFPSALGGLFSKLNLDSPEPGQMGLGGLVLILFLFISVIAGTILVVQGQRRIPLQYARRVVGRREMQGGGASFIPLKVNYAGVIPVIFASALLMFPATVGQFLGNSSLLGRMAAWISPGTPVYMICFVFLIFFFAYFWTSTQFHPERLASDMKRGSAFIPGVRQGKATQNFLDQTMNRVTFIGASALSFLAILPSLFSLFLGVERSISYFLGGTSLLILVGVVLDTLRQIESHLLMKRYKGFMKSPR